MKRFMRNSYGYLKNIKETSRIEKRVISINSSQAGSCLQLEWELTAREAIFNNLINQQKRGYAPVISTTARECWNCKKERNDEDVMTCQHCGRLQDVNTEINYFKLLDFPAKFNLELQTLTRRFRQLQTIVHPDKFSNKTFREQKNSASWSSLINKAYKTLSIPIERGRYLLELNGLQMPQDNSTLNKEFLMEMMERNEEVECATSKKELDTINERLTKELSEKVDALTRAFDSNNFDIAKSLLVEMKYLISIQKTVKNKLQTLLGR